MLTEVQGNEADVDTAVKAARKAYESWSTTPGHVRARFMYSIARHIQKHHRLLAVLESMDNGKPIRETRDCDIPVVARWFYHYAGWAQVRASAAWAICLCLYARVVMCSVENKNQITKQKKKNNTCSSCLVKVALTHIQLAETEMRGWAPIGVVGGIVAWNFPLMLLAWKVRSWLCLFCAKVLVALAPLFAGTKSQVVDATPPRWRQLWLWATRW